MLRKNISALGANDGLKRAREMAERMANPWARLHAIWQNIRIAVGSTLLPVISSLVNKLANAGQLLVRWLKLFSNIARWVGYITLSILSFAAAGAAANLVMGVSKFIWIGLKGIWAACTLVMKLGAAAVWLYNAAIIAWNTTLRVLHGVLRAVRIAAFLAGISFSFMTWPILLIIAAIALLAVGIYLLIRHWDAIKAALMNTTAFRMVAAYVKWVGGIFSAVWGGIAEGWNNLCNGFSRFSLADTFAGIVENIGNIFGGLWDWLMNSFSDSYHWIIDKLNNIPGINIGTQAIEKTVIEPVGKGNEPRFCHNRISIGQDCVHAIIESGLATKLIAERSPTLRADIHTQIGILVEDDERIIPGTVIINEESPIKLWITAETYDFGRINVSVSSGNETDD